MFTKVKTATLAGVQAQQVTVEVDSSRGLPGLTIVGLADTTIKEACGRIKPALNNSGYRFPGEKVTVNLVPAGSPKLGSHFDLPIAIGILMLGRDKGIPEDTAVLGELSLDGKVNRINGALPLALSLRKSGIKNIILPQSNAEEVSVLNDVNILPAETLADATEHISGVKKIAIYNRKKKIGKPEYDVDFSQVTGQEAAKRAVVIAAAGNHGILMIGGAGCGKTMIARRIPTILPELDYEEQLEITGIYSVAGLLDEMLPIINERPFRSPHHTVSVAGLVGGGIKPKPGELSLAHRGVLFLDEFGEFDSRAIDTMRQPVEDGEIKLKRGMQEVTFPSEVMLVAAANPCKCGNLWDDRKICTCTSRQLESYIRKLNGPFSDRIDMHIKMNPVGREDLYGGKPAQKTTSAEMRKQVEAAVLLQKERYRNLHYRNNASLDEKGIAEFCELDEGCRNLMSMAYEKLGLSVRAHNRLLKVARTIADLEGEGKIRENHIAEALTYRISDWRQI